MIEDGFRESAQSWRELLLRPRDENGLKVDPELATGDATWASGKRCMKFGARRARSATGFIKLPTFSTSCRHRCKVRRRNLRAIYQAENRESAEKAFDRFIEKYSTKHYKATDCPVKDRAAIFASFNFPVEHWNHVRTSSPIESTFATVRLRIDKKTAFHAKRPSPWYSRSIKMVQERVMTEVAWVIGLGGIGGAVARLLSRDHRVTTFDRHSGADVRIDLADCTATINVLRDCAHPSPDTVVLCFGTVSEVAPGGEPVEIARVIDDNLSALISVLGVLSEVAQVRCVVVVSNAAFLARPNQAVYAAAKAAAVSLIRSTAVAWGSRRSTIYGVAPGTVVVPRNKEKLALRFPQLPHATDRPGGRICLPDDVAGFVLATLPFSVFLTGHCLPFDAGSSLV